MSTLKTGPQGRYDAKPRGGARYWAVRPARMDLNFVRIERARTAAAAIRLAFGMGMYAKDHPMAHTDRGRWLVKDMGTQVRVLQSDSKRIALLTDEQGWFDPSQERDQE